MMPINRNIAMSLFTILLIGFIYRITLTTMNTYPPGADIGLHQSVINSILSSKTTFNYNYYHMGGGVSATNPGYHIFTAFVITMTGASEYLVQAIIASMFSTMIALAAFLLVKQVWGEVAALVVATLAIFSSSDIIMLSWAGYPNIIALALIPILFYLFLKQEKINSMNYNITVSLIVCGLFLTHVFSALVFLTIAMFMLLLMVLFSKSTGFTVKKLVYLLIPIFLGIMLVSPYLISVFPLYFGSEGAISGNISVMNQAVIETRVVPIVISCITIVPMVLFLVFSKKQHGKFFTIPSLLFISALLVPLVATQGHLFGFFLDYQRFLYFLTLPSIVCIGLIIVTALNILTKRIYRIKRRPSILTKSALICLLIIVCLSTSFSGYSVFALPDKGMTQANYFQVITPMEYEAIAWIKNNTPENSVCVADANFGWWLSGFAKRSTLSAVDPQFLILKREFDPAQAAINLMHGDYLVENGILRIEQKEPYAQNSSYNIYAQLENSLFKPLVFSLDNTQVCLLYREDGASKEMTLNTFGNSNTQVVNDGNSTSFIISGWKKNLKITEEITLYKGIRFAEINFVFQSDDPVNFDWLILPFQSRGELLQYENSIGLVDHSSKWINQIIFPYNQLGKDVMLQETPDNYQLVCDLRGSNNIKINFFVGLCPYEINLDQPEEQYYNQLIENNTRTYLSVINDKPLNSFDYRTALRQWNISYIAVRDPQVAARFIKDPVFEVVFRNSNITIFGVIGI